MNMTVCACEALLPQRPLAYTDQAGWLQTHADVASRLDVFGVQGIIDVFGVDLMCFELIALRSSWVIDCVHVLSHLSFVECHCFQTCPTAWLPQCLQLMCLQLFSVAWAPQPGRFLRSLCTGGVAPGHWLCLLPVEFAPGPLFLCLCRRLAACLVPRGLAPGTWLLALRRTELLLVLGCLPCTARSCSWCHGGRFLMRRLDGAQGGHA